MKYLLRLFYEVRLTHDLYPDLGWSYALRIGWRHTRLMMP